MKHIKVWDIFIRIFHWSTVAIVLINFTIFDEGTVHETLGYILMGLLGLRLVWGFVGSEYSRFSNFFPTPTKVKQHLKEIKEGKSSTHIGHNPIGAVMIFNLYLTLVMVSLTGYMAVSDRFWGVEWVEELHEFFAAYLLFSVAIHVIGVVWESLRSGVNLIYAMVTGIKKL